jgi:molybdopterin converting factor small subunit
VSVTVRLPQMFHPVAGAEVEIEEPVSDLAGVRAALTRRFPKLAVELADPILNFAINDVMLLHGVGDHPVRDGDVVEIVPTIAGG